MRLSLPSYRAFIGVVLLATVAIAGCNKSSDDTVITPTAATNLVIDSVSSTAVQVAGSINNYISGTISAYGICWSATNKTPTLSDSKTSATVSGTVRFAGNMTGLTPNTVYYVRAYATSTSPATTVYGNVLQITTPTATYAVTGAVSTFAGLTAGGYTEGAKASALFSSPQGVVADAAGNLYIADSFNNAIRKISTSGTVTTLAGGANAGFVNGTGAAASFYSPQYIAIDASGNLYVTDVGNNAIRKVTPAGVVTTFAGGNGPGYVDGSGLSVKFYNPAGLAVDASGNVYVADRSNNLIRKITSAGVVSTFAGNQTRGIGDATGTAAYFNNPIGVAVDAQGVVYIADTGNNAIRQIIADGTVSTYIASPTAQPALLNLPVGMAFDKSGNLFITDQSGRVMEVTATNKALYSIAGNINTNGYTDGSGTAAKFDKPYGITTDAAGNVYVADYNNNLIRKVAVTVTQ